MMKTLLLLVATATAVVSSAQNVSINNDASLPDNSAILDIKSSLKGLLIPRMNTASVEAIVNPAKGLLVLDTSKNQLMVNMGSASSPNWQTIVASSGWGLSGNSGIDSSTNFIGTLNTKPFIIRVNNMRSGYLDTMTNNTSFGFRALESFTTGDWNTAFGYRALSANTVGTNNVGIGWSALRANTGHFNSALGAFGLFTNTTGSQNTAIGQLAMYLNTTGSRNAALGSDALRYNTIGNDNIGIGYTALYFNVSGYSNIAIGTGALFNSGNRNNLVAIGDSALFNNGIGATLSEHGIANTAVGSKALYSNTTGYFNTAIGSNSLLSNTTGVQNVGLGTGSLRTNTTGFGNTAAGFNSLFSNSTGSENTAFGNFALPLNVSGLANTSSGSYSLYNNTAGNSNTSIGSYSLHQNQSGHSNVAIGTHALFNSGNRSNLVAIGDSALFNNGIGASWYLHGHSNTAVGSKALFNNTTGYTNTANGYNAMYTNTSGEENTALGFNALYLNSTGYTNTAIGIGALEGNTTGFFNTATGGAALRYNGGGSYNSAYGTFSFEGNTSGGYNTALGSFTSLGSNGYSNSTVIGAHAQANCSNCVILGSVVGVNGAGSNVNVGIGTTNPDAPLSFGSSAGKKITLFNNGPNNQHGLGVQAGLLQVYADVVGSDIAFGYGSSTNFVERMRIKGNGFVGVGTTAPATRLDVAGANNWDLTNTEGDFRVGNGSYRIKMGIALDGGGAGAATIRSAGGIERLNLGAANTNLLTLNGASGNVGIGTETPSQKLQVIGNISATGTITPSDARYKRDILRITNPLEKISQLNGVTYYYRNSEFTKLGFSKEEQVGVIAQEVEKVLPQLVFTDGEGYKSVDYTKLVPLLIEGMKEQQKQIENSAEEMRELRKQVAELRRMMKALPCK